MLLFRVLCFGVLSSFFFGKCCRSPNTRDLSVKVLSVSSHAVDSCFVAGYGPLLSILGSSCGSWSQVSLQGNLELARVGRHQTCVHLVCHSLPMFQHQLTVHKRRLIHNHWIQHKLNSTNSNKSIRKPHLPRLHSSQWSKLGRLPNRKIQCLHSPNLQPRLRRSNHRLGSRCSIPPNRLLSCQPSRKPLVPRLRLQALHRPLDLPGHPLRDLRWDQRRWKFMVPRPTYNHYSQRSHLCRLPWTG